MTKRAHISKSERVKIFQRNDGMCHLCDQLVTPGQDWHVSHEIPLECGGADDDKNRRVAHAKCHRLHTAKVDAPLIAKVKRQHAKHIGAKTSKGKMRGRPRRLPANPASDPLMKSIPQGQGLYK